jgi:hypothetical protein
LHEAENRKIMARLRQLYEDVMDVALRATLKEFGFKRKSYATYIMERPDRRWYFELEAEPRLGTGFEDMAGVHIPALDAICEKHIPGVWVFHAVNRTEPSAHVTANIPQLMEIAEGHNFYRPDIGFTSKRRRKGFEIVKHPEIVDFRSYHRWAKPTHLLPSRSEVSKEEYDRIEADIFDRWGHFLDDQWRAHVLTWYERCDDPLFVIDWLENHQGSGGTTIDLTCAILYHLAGDNGLAAECLRKTVQEAEISYEDHYRTIYRDRGGSWFRRLYDPGTWTKERVAKSAAGALEWCAERAEAARRLASGLGIRL